MNRSASDDGSTRALLPSDDGDFLGVSLIDPDGRFCEVNETLCEILGRPAAELRTLTYSAIVHPDDYGREAKHLARTLAGKVAGYSLEERYVRPEGEVRWVHVRASVVGECVVRRTLDVTERRRAEEALARSQEQSQRIFDESTIGMAVKDADLRFVRVNAAFSRVLGYTEEELVGRSFAEVTHPEDVTIHAGLARRLFAGEIPGYDIEQRYVRRDGEVVWCRLRATVIEFGPANLRHHLAMVEDVTEVRRAEALRREYDDLKDAFLRVASHDLQGPLAIIAGLAEVLASPGSETDAEAQRDGLRRIASQAHRLQHMVGAFLDFDRLYHDDDHAHRRPTDLVALTTRVVEAVDLGDRPLVIEAESPLVAVDPDLVERILENLLANTVVHTPPGAPVWVRVTAADAVSLVVEDAGPGVPDHLKEAVFDLFRTVDPEARRGGTGLWVVNRLAELHGGRALVEDRPGGGASFRVLLPTSSTVGPGPVSDPCD